MGNEKSMIEIPKLRVYLDTSIVNFLYADDAPVYKKETERFFETVLAPGKIDAYISGVVMGEINDTTDGEKRNKLLDTINKYTMIKMLDTATEEQARDLGILANAYVASEIIPQNKKNDAFHIAYATVFTMDILLSWNFKHLANLNKEQKIRIVNKNYGFTHPFRMANPLEVVFYDEYP
jgi:hypothetical protein